MNVELHIERLVLTGVALPPGGRAALSRAFGRELTRLIQAGGLPPALLGGTSVPRLTAVLDPSVPASPSVPAPDSGRRPGKAGSGGGSPLGGELARSVYSCLGRS